MEQLQNELVIFVKKRHLNIIVSSSYKHTKIDNKRKR